MASADSICHQADCLIPVKGPLPDPAPNTLHILVCSILKTTTQGRYCN